jgi:formamidase
VSEGETKVGRVHRIAIDRTEPLSRQPRTGHNRWHPDIQPILTVEPGSTVVLETRDALDGMITPDTRASDLDNIEMGRIHPLTGPVYVKGAEPGDLLEVKITDVRPESFGFTAILPGFGILRECFRNPFLAKWKISNGEATSAQLPNVWIPGTPFMGVMGVAPSRELLERVERRESDLLKRGGMVLPPSPEGAVPATEPIKQHGLRTVPPRENGGNIDIRHLSVGTTVYFPVFVRGALFSAGDAHFAQGDCESCGTAIEIGATLEAELQIHKKAATESHMRGPHYTRFKGTGPRLAARGPFYATTGIPLSDDGQNEAEDVTLAAKNALLSMIDHIVLAYGFSREEAYALTSVAVDLHISELVDVPNVLVSAFLPLEIFVKNHISNVKNHIANGVERRGDYGL